MLEDHKAMPGALPLLAPPTRGCAHGAVGLHPRVPACPSPVEQLQEGWPWQGQVMTLKLLQMRPLCCLVDYGIP